MKWEEHRRTRASARQQPAACPGSRRTVALPPRGEQRCPSCLAARSLLFLGFFLGFFVEFLAPRAFDFSSSFLCCFAIAFGSTAGAVERPGELMPRNVGGPPASRGVLAGTLSAVPFLSFCRFDS
jgi:hypothetical protein